MKYRLKQFIWAITSIFYNIDESVINTYLDYEEKLLFNKLKKSEKQHSIRVCNMALSKYMKDNSLDKRKLAKIALLHDIGKSQKPLTIIDKSIIVILDKITNGNLKKLIRSEKIDIYYNHGNKSVELLRDNNNKQYDNEFIEAIEKHHYLNEDNNIYLNIIKECDNIS